MLKNMKISKRLIIGFVLAIILSSISGVIGVALLSKSDRDYSTVLENYGFAQGELGTLGDHFQGSRAVNLYILTASDKTARDEYMKELLAEDAIVDDYMHRVEARIASDVGREVYANLSNELNAFRSARDEVIATSERSSDIKKNIALYREKVTEPAAAVRATLDKMISDKTNIGTEKSAGLTSQMIIFRAIIIAAMLTSFTIAIIIAWSIAKGISIPITQIERAAEQMSKGNYDDVEITHVGQDEIGNLAESMRKMISVTKEIIADTARGLAELEKGNFNVRPQVEYIGVFAEIESALGGIITGLSSTISQINQASEQVSSGSDQVSSGAQALSQGATEQASSVQELAATINEISQQVKDNAGNARSASKKAGLAGEEVTLSNQKMQDLIAAMGEISNSSKEIGKVIKTIEDIAFQTNILALNAAVEAARAGAAGKGFAVVADEVRNLASKSAEAAKGTTALIENSIKAVENGTHIVDDTAGSLVSVVDSTKELSTLVNKISTASDEQATSIAQVTMGVDQISSVIQTNSATAEESAAASEELSSQAQMLKNLVAKFELLDTSVIPVNQIVPTKKNFSVEIPSSSFETFESDKY